MYAAPKQTRRREAAWEPLPLEPPRAQSMPQHREDPNAVPDWPYKPSGRSLSANFLPTAPPPPAPRVGPRLDYKELQELDSLLPTPAHRPLCQVRFCIGGLLALSALRGCALNVFLSPAGVAWTAHLLSVTADCVSMIGSLPLFATSAIGMCVNHRCLGSLLTLLLTASICDIGSFVMYVSASGGFFRLMGPVATDEGAPSSLAYFGVWECILLSSVAMEAALCFSAWEVYRSLREAGVYPPASGHVRVPQKVSALELLCEAEDVALLSEHDYCTCGGDRRPYLGVEETEPQVTDFPAWTASPSRGRPEEAGQEKWPRIALP